MRFNGGAPLSWSRLERILSGRPGPEPVPIGHTDTPAGGAYGEAVAAPQSASRPAPPQRERRLAKVPFAELHAVSSYSFLGGASEPEELVARAVELGLSAVGLLDRDGVYGAVKFAEAAAAAAASANFTAP